ncbi:SDR family NAD(P)-dependent oxidoreductase [Paenibacillus piri]|uniref:SDR family oxidoreductase n=1 Tax=Paenibacillus piri TaxID=2547395 RepID=A0A4R5K781_9BACL|nr:SDR family NAD(P)-dependent oxidoreductase [Paenibacillus piri]TDF89746.1 SDR family oxidoreductase [Paenibacillus piri]
MDLQGKTVLITGAATGIGRAIALCLAKEGANVAVNYSKSASDAEVTKSEVEKHNVRALVIQADVGNKEEVERMVEQTIAYFGTIDVLINNAGTTQFIPLHDLDGLLEEHWDHILNVNVKGMFFASRACASELRRNKGCIVNITSIAGFNGAGSSIAYAASKAAGISLTKSFARVLAPDVRVNSIAPGIVITRWVDGREEHVKQYSDKTLLGRPAYPEDVAELTAAVIRGGDFITGQTLVVDGGWSL